MKTKKAVTEEKKKVFLTFITRTFKRPQSLLVNQKSLKLQTDQDFTQKIIEDKKGVGTAAADALLAGIEVDSEYVYVFDDDEEVVNIDFVAAVKRTARQKEWTPLTNPDLIIVPSIRGNMTLGIYPKPELGNIGMPNCVWRKDTWDKFKVGYKRPPGDWFIIEDALKDETVRVAKIDQMMVKSQYVGLGLSEADHQKGDMHPRSEKTSLPDPRQFVRIGESVRCIQACSGSGFSYSDVQVIKVSEENIDVLDSLARGGLVEVIPNSFPGKTIYSPNSNSDRSKAENFGVAEISKRRKKS